MSGTPQEAWIEEQLAFAVRKEDTALLDALDEGLIQLMASPDWDALKAQYHVG